MDIIAVNPGDTVKITEINNGVTAIELGINGTGVGVINGTDVDPALELGTALADIPVLTSLPLGSIIVRTGNTTTTTNFSNPPPAATIGEEISRFNLAIPQLQMPISPDGLGL